MGYLQLALKAVKPTITGNEKREESKIRLVKTMTEARRQSLEDAMTEILVSARDRITARYAGGQYTATHEIRQAETAIDTLYHEVIAGEAGIDDFGKAVRQWEGLCLRFRDLRNGG